jgi:polar amino acid transport system substrate-binding protein
MPYSNLITSSFIRKTVLFALGLVLSTSGQLFAAESSAPAKAPAPAAAAAPAEPDAPQHLVVVVKPVAPFVMNEDGKLSGYSIDLWNEVARYAGWKDVEFKVVTTVPEMIEALKSGQADVGVGALSITAERSKEIDFSHPFYDSGLDIMVKGGGAPGPFELLRRLFTPALVLTFLGIMVALIIVSHILWWFERKHNHEDFPHNYAQGMIESVWWTTCVLIGGMCMNKDPRGITGRVVGTAWALVGIAMISYLTATATSIMTVDSLGNDISGPKDLIGKSVATISGTSAEKYLQGMHVNLQGYKTLDDAVDALKLDKVKAVVYDSPVMMYYLAENQSKELHLVNHLFDKQKYGFGLQPSSKLRHDLNSALLSIEETDFTEQLDKKYFTPTEQ